MTDGADLLPTGSTPELSRSRLMTFFWLAAAASLILPRIPYGRNVLYPFALLGTWAHEMGHGVMAVLLGGSFERLEVYRNLGGVAFHSGLGDFAGVLVSAAGLLGPAIVGGLVIVFGARATTARWVLAVLGVVVLLSVLLVVRNAFGVVSLILIGSSLVALGFFAPESIRVGLAQLVGIQFCFASWGTLDYMFTSRFVRDGQTFDSDTQNIADVLVLPYWFWGGVTAALSAAIMGYAFYRAWLRPARRTASTTPVI